MGVLPVQPVAAAPARLAQESEAPLAAHLLDDLWQRCDAGSWFASRADFELVVVRIARSHNFGLLPSSPAPATPAMQEEFLSSPHMPDLVLARACADGSERAWDRFLALYRPPLLRAAVAITSSESLGRELADSLYAELYGMTARDGERRCPLLSYSGRGALVGWLRTTLAQRHVDRFRITGREAPLDENTAEITAAPASVQSNIPDPLLQRAVRHALGLCDAQERFLLSSYYLDGRTLDQIARVLGVHEATVSRRLHKTAISVRKRILKYLEKNGLSRRAAEEAMLTDPRDLTGRNYGRDVDRDTLRLKELLQASTNIPFNKQADR